MTGTSAECLCYPHQVLLFKGFLRLVAFRPLKVDAEP